MADYESFPLWRRDAVGTANVDPTSLPISADLARQLSDWAAEYDGTLDRGDPLASGFTDPTAEAAFHARGEELAKRLAGALPAGFTVEYFDGRNARVYPVP
jgi:hypothetical protein